MTTRRRLLTAAAGGLIAVPAIIRPISANLLLSPSGGGPPPPGTFTFLTHAQGSGTPTGTTTPGVDTTGANLIVVAAHSYNNTAPTVTDNKGNGAPTLAVSNAAGVHAFVFLYYWYGPTVGAGHTFTCDGNFGGLQMLGFSGAHTSPVDHTNSNFSSVGVTSIQPGSITPSQINCLVVTAVSGANNTDPDAIDSGFTISDFDPAVGGTSIGSGAAYIIQTSIVTVDPTWTLDMGGTSDSSACIASFKAA